MNEINLIMQIVSILVLGYIVYQRSAHANYFRKAGYKTWGFNKVNEPYSEIREFKMQNTSWLCKSHYIGFGFEFWWSPGGGFSITPYFINTFIIVMFISLSIFAWPVALFSYLIYFLLAMMMA